MTEKEKIEFKQKLEETIVDTQKTIDQLIIDTQPISPENSLGRITRMDAINNKGVAEASLRATKRKMAKLKMAMTKVDEPNFGDCSNCSAPIPVQRLMFMPESTYCVGCASRR